jgi:type I restriction enzyme S subunit
MKEEQNMNGLPKDWKWLKLGDIVSLLGDGLHGTPEYSTEGDYYFINGNNLGDGKILIKENTKRVSFEQFKKYKKDLNGNTIFVSINGTIGNVAFYKNEKIVLGKSACYFNVKESVDKSYIGLLLKGQRFLNYANNSATGSTIKNVSLKAMREFELPVPPKETQQQIVSKIEELFSEIDKGVEELKTTQQQLKVYRQAVLKWAVEGKLTNEDVLEGELPKGWKVVKLKEIAKKITDGEHATPLRTPSGVLLLSARNIHNGELRLSDVDYVGEEEYERIIKRCFPEEGDILISCSGSVGRICRVPRNLKFVMVRSVALLKLDWTNYSSKYFEYLLQSSFLQKQIEKGKKATAQANLFLGPINNLDVIICSLKEQQQIVQEIESRLSVCDKIEETITNSLKQAEALRQSILKKAFEGKL